MAELIRPLLADDALLADVERAIASPGRLHLWWLGQSGFLVAWNRLLLALDPYLSDSLTAKYAGTDRPHVRLTARVVAPERLAGVAVVTASHGHTDHLDAETLRPLAAASPGLVLVCPEAIRALGEERSGLPADRVRGIDLGGCVEPAPGVLVHAVPAAHETVERDASGRCLFLGYVVACGPFRLYHAGDTVLAEGLVDAVAPFEVDVALLPINGRDPARGVPGNLDGPEAARLARAIGARLAVPCHFEMFAFNTASPVPFAEEARRLGQPVAVLRAGERLSLSGA